jgi:hypothetical protein
MVPSYGGALLDHLADHLIISPLPLPSGIASIQAMTMNFTYPNDWVCPQSGRSAAAVADHEDGAVETIP